MSKMGEHYIRQMNEEEDLRLEKRAKKAAYDKVRREKDPEKVKGIASRSYYSHKEKISVKNKAYYHAHLEQERARARVYAANRKEARQAYQKMRREAHPEVARARLLKSKHGLSLSDFDILLKSQGGGCAICRTEKWNSKGPCVDHSHDTKRTRGILCHNCNTALGHIKDDPNIAQVMKEYLEKWRIK